MKLSDIFKKETTKVVNSKIQSLDKNQLEKVIGGGGPSVPSTTDAVTFGREKLKATT
jgi:hypothetical protein